jgi:hypothetical protein
MCHPPKAFARDADYQEGGRLGRPPAHCGHGYRRRRFGNREDWVRRLEEYQRDLEQELADVSDVIKRLREEKPEAQPVRI